MWNILLLSTLADVLELFFRFLAMDFVHCRLQFVVGGDCVSKLHHTTHHMGKKAIKDTLTLKCA
jgi:hypothetical protein